MRLQSGSSSKFWKNLTIRSKKQNTSIISKQRHPSRQNVCFYRYLFNLFNLYFLGVNDDDGACELVALYVIWSCLGSVDVVDDDSWMACIEPNLGDDCHDPICSVLDDGSSFLSCSDDTTAKAKLFKVLNKSYSKVPRRAHIKSLKTKMSFTSKRM